MEIKKSVFEIDTILDTDTDTIFDTETDLGTVVLDTPIYIDLDISENKIKSKVDEKVETKVESEVDQKAENKIESKVDQKIENKIESKIEREFEIILPLTTEQRVKDKQILDDILSKEKILARNKREKFITDIERELQEFEYRQLGEKRGHESKFSDFMDYLLVAHDRRKILALPIYSTWFWKHLQVVTTEIKHSFQTTCDIMCKGVDHEGDFFIDVNPIKLARFLREHCKSKLKKGPKDKTLQCMEFLLNVKTKTKNNKDFEFTIESSAGKYDVEYAIREIKPKSQDMTETMQDYCKILMSKDSDLSCMPIGRQRTHGILGSMTVPCFGFWFE